MNPPFVLSLCRRDEKKTRAGLQEDPASQGKVAEEEAWDMAQRGEMSSTWHTLKCLVRDQRRNVGKRYEPGTDLLGKKKNSEGPQAKCLRVYRATGVAVRGMEVVI